MTWRLKEVIQPFIASSVGIGMLRVHFVLSVCFNRIECISHDFAFHHDNGQSSSVLQQPLLQALLHSLPFSFHSVAGQTHLCSAQWPPNGHGPSRKQTLTLALLSSFSSLNSLFMLKPLSTPTLSHPSSPHSRYSSRFLIPIPSSLAPNPLHVDMDPFPSSFQEITSLEDSNQSANKVTAIWTSQF